MAISTDTEEPGLLGSQGHSCTYCTDLIGSGSIGEGVEVKTMTMMGVPSPNKMAGQREESDEREEIHTQNLI